MKDRFYCHVALALPSKGRQSLRQPLAVQTQARWAVRGLRTDGRNIIVFLRRSIVPEHIVDRSVDVRRGCLSERIALPRRT